MGTGSELAGTLTVGDREFVMKRLLLQRSYCCYCWLTSSFAQDWIKTGTGLGVEKVRLAVPDFNASTQDAKNADLLKAFNDTLWNDLDNAGIFDMVSKSFYPLGQVGTPADVKFEAWSAPPPNAAMLAFGNLGVTGNSMTVQGWLYDVKNVDLAAGAGQTVSGCRAPATPPAPPPTNSPMRLSSGWAAALPGLRKARFIS